MSQPNADQSRPNLQVNHLSSQPPARARKPREKNQKQREQALDLVRRLEALQAEFSAPVFQDIFEIAMRSARRLAESTRRSERDAVLVAIYVRGCRSVEEICEDEEVGLTRRVVQPILDDLVMHDMVYISEKFTHECDRREGGRPELEYHPAASDLSSATRK